MIGGLVKTIRKLSRKVLGGKKKHSRKHRRRSSRKHSRKHSRKSSRRRKKKEQQKGGSGSPLPIPSSPPILRSPGTPVKRNLLYALESPKRYRSPSSEIYGTPRSPGSPQPQSPPSTHGPPPNSPHKVPKAEYDENKYRKEVNHNEALITSIILRNPYITPTGRIQTESKNLVLYSEPFGESLYNKFREDDYNNIFKMNLYPQINQALLNISKMGIMLCDISPANTLVNEHNEIRLIDFEFAHHNENFNQKMVYAIMLATALHTLTIGDAISMHETTTNQYDDEYNAVMGIMKTFLTSINAHRQNEKYRTNYFEYVQIYSFELDEEEFKKMVFNIYKSVNV